MPVGSIRIKSFFGSVWRGVHEMYQDKQVVATSEGQAGSFEDGRTVEVIRIESELGIAAAMEAKRLSEKYGKDFLNCDDLVAITGFGKNNVRQMLNSDDFPTVEVGNRKAVSIVAFVLWSLKKGDRHA
jgi:hypothetical protein